MTERLKKPQEVFGPFLVFERLGVGGTATVFRAKRFHEDGTELEVSLKRLHPHLASDERVVREFVHEARIARLLEHEHICRFYEVGRNGHEYFIASEFIDGEDVGTLLQSAGRSSGPPPISVTMTLLVQLCDALEYAHGQVDRESGRPLDFVHRDISPSNLLVTRDGVLKLIDMGIAKARTRTVQTDVGIIKGKLAYMAPDVVAGGDATVAADIFSLGVVAWEMLTARRLFGGGSEQETIKRIRAGAVEAPSAHNPLCPPQIDKLVMRALARRASARWPSAGALRRELDAAAASLGETLSAEIVADWLRALHGAAGAEGAKNEEVEGAELLSEDMTTQVRKNKVELTRPVRSRRFATGTGQLALAAPDRTGAKEKEDSPAAYQPTRAPSARHHAVPLPTSRATPHARLSKSSGESRDDDAPLVPLALARTGAVCSPVAQPPIPPQAASEPSEIVSSLLSAPTATTLVPKRTGRRISTGAIGSKLRLSQHGRRRLRLVSSTLAASLVVNVVLAIGLIAASTPSDDREDHAATSRPASENVVAIAPDSNVSNLSATSDVAKARRPQRARRESKRKPARKHARAKGPVASARLRSEPVPTDKRLGEKPVTKKKRARARKRVEMAQSSGPSPSAGPSVDVRRLELRRGAHPRSRGSRAAYRARLCLDVRGKVVSVNVLAGPERLHRRIRRTLSRWRYRPFKLGNVPTAVCTEFTDRLRKWR